MSAICGILRLDGAAIRSGDIERQINTMSRRGRDRRGIFSDGPIGLGHALMRVTEEDAFDEQPLIDRAAGLTLIADLRLDNREELAQALAVDNHTLRRLPDSALLMRAYRKWGENCAEHLLGDFVFALWDAGARKLVLGRDHMGARYAYYYRGPDFFVFASETKGLWAVPDVPHRLDEFEIGKALTIDLSQPRGATRFAEIFGLLPAAVMTVAGNGDTQSRRYWVPQADPAHVGRDEAYYVETYRRVLTEAVQCRLRRNTRATGLFLSGGFDSAAVAALAGPVMSEQKRKLIAAASVMPPGHDAMPMDARKWVEACDRHMPHLDVRYVTREGFGLLDKLDEHFVRMDESTGVDRVANTAMLTVIAGCGARVVMDGQGGDYTLNARARGWLSEQLVPGRLRSFVSELRAYRRNRDLPFWTVIKQEVIKPLLPERITTWLRTRKSSSPDEPIAPITGNFARSIRAKGGQLRFTMPNTGAKGYFARQSAVLALEQGKAGNATHLAASQYGLEYVQPFHDKRVVEFGLAIPPSLVVRDGRNRYLARRALGELYPPELRVRPDGNDNRAPDLLDIAERARPEMLQQIARMEKDARLTRYFDFARMRKMLEPPATKSYPLDAENRLRHAIRAFFMARFIAWVERDNRSAV